MPEAKFVYVVRDPIARTISHYKMGVALMGERRSLSEALGDLSDQRSPYIASSLYGLQMELYLSHFGRERFHLVNQADLLGDRDAAMAGIFDFLEVDADAQLSGLDEELLNSSGWRAYSPRYLKIVNRYLAPAVRWVPRDLRRSVRRRVESVLWPPLKEPVLDDKLLARLKELYGAQADRLRELSGMPFPGWSV